MTTESTPVRNNKFINFLHAIVRWLFEPSSSVVGYRQRRRSRFLSAFLLVHAIESLIGAIFTLNPVNSSDNLWLLLLFTGVMLAVTYILSRTSYYRLSVCLAITIPALPSFGEIILTGGNNEPLQAIVWLALPLLICSLLLSLRTTIIVTAGYIFFTILLVPFAGLPPMTLGIAIPFLFLISIIAGIISAIRQRDLSEIEEQLSSRERAENTLKQQKELTDRILESTPNAVLVVDRNSDIILTNRTFRRNANRKKDEIEGNPLRESIPEEEINEAVSTVLANKQNKRTLEFRHRGKKKDMICVADVIAMGEEQALIIISDVTEDRERQERLYLTDRLASVGEMASGIAHELNNPLTSIIGLSELILEEEELPEELAGDIRAIYGEARRTAGVVRNLLSFARKHVPVKKATQLNKVLEDVLALRAYEHRVNNINVNTTYDPELSEVMVDYFQMQ